MNCQIVRYLCLGIVATVLLFAAAAKAATGIPRDSDLQQANTDWQRLLLNPMENVTTVKDGGWKLGGTYVTPTNELTPKLGHTALTLGARQAEQGGAKGDFAICDGIRGEVQTIGLWVHMTDQANIARMGVQVRDAEGEALMMLVSADWTGWKWIECNLSTAEQSYSQTDKNGLADFPLNSVHIVWFTASSGATSLTVDGAVALTRLSDTIAETLSHSLAAPETVAPNTRLPASISATNFSSQPTRINVSYSLQQDPALYSRPIPDAVFGSDHAAGTDSWLVVDGEKLENNSLTDGKPWTASTTPWQREHFSEAFQFVDLGQERVIRKMTWLSGDANHTWFVDVFASVDGETFTAVPSLNGVDQFKKWGWREFPLEAPFRARVLKFCYRTDGKQENLIAFPSELHVYDGADDEIVDLPTVGPLVEQGTISLEVPPRSFSVQALEFTQTLPSGSYLLGLSVEREGASALSYRHVFCQLQLQPELVSPSSRIALNAAHADLAPKLRELGVGFVRFENGKWPFVSAKPHQYSFSGDVAPWHLDLDQIFQTYHDAGLGVLSYMFLTPTWASSAPADAAEKMRLAFPPKDLSWYGEFCFQMAARYSSRQHPDDALLTPDKRSGLDLVKYYEMWNEPNLNPSPEATWGGWAAPMEPYYEMMRFGAEAVKRADPDAVVTSAGYAGMSTDIVDPLRTYRYTDGKRPLDFVEVLNVHFYSGQEPPETCKTDGNAKITSTTTFTENLKELANWRDRYAPEMPIWMTETGYDSAGPFGTSEAIQAARLPRVVMLCLANGVEKVFVYRESGSTPSMHACSGVLRNDFSPKPSWYTMGTMIRQLHGVQGGALRLPHPDPNVWLMEWDADGAPLLTVWTADGTAPLGIDLGRCIVTDSFGGVTTTNQTGDITVTSYPLYLRAFENLETLQQLRDEHARRETTRLERLERIAALQKYLFDFGSTEHVGRDNLEGHRTDYTPVLATDTWQDERGYGFDKAAFRDEDQPWMGGQKLDRDGTRVRDHAFRFRVAPGRYDLTVKVVPFNPQGKLMVTGDTSGPQTLEIDKKTPEQTIRIQVTSAAPEIQVQLQGDYGHFRWIRCVEVLDP